MVLFYSLSKKNLSLPITILIQNTTPILIYILNFLIYKVKLNKGDIFGIILGFIGIILVIDPVLLYNLINNTPNNNNNI